MHSLPHSQNTQPCRAQNLTCLSILGIFFGLSCCALQDAQASVPRFEFGPVLSAAKQTELDVGQAGRYLHYGGGGRFMVNVHRYIGGEVELTRQRSIIYKAR